MVSGTDELGGALRARLQLSLGGVAELGEEIACVAGRRRFAALERGSARPVIVTLHAPSPAGPDASALRRRLDELRVLGHATVDLPIACGEIDGCAWVADAAPTLPIVSDRLATGPLPLAQAVSVIRDLARALAAMHRRDICHGAIDLDVIGIDRHGARLGGVGLSLGASRRDDLDALAEVAWAILSGERRPTAVRTLSQLRRGVSPKLDALCTSLLAPDPNDRPQRAEAILDALDAVPTARGNPLSSIVDLGGHDTRPRRGLGWLMLGAAIAALAVMLSTRA
jgi:serine/threonine-protein kinase